MVVRIAGSAVEVVVTLPVAQPQRHVGLAEQHGARVAQALHHARVARGEIAAKRRVAHRGGPARHVERLLDRERHAVERTARAPCRQFGVALARDGVRALEIADHDGIDGRVLLAPRRLAGGDQRARTDLLTAHRGSGGRNRGMTPRRCAGLGLRGRARGAGGGQELGHGFALVDSILYTVSRQIYVVKGEKQEPGKRGTQPAGPAARPLGLSGLAAARAGRLSALCFAAKSLTSFRAAATSKP
ncbi:hypothetical protein PUN4_1030049 [Paraburkholderia unamae]|nr:hypothetical protein PUN4_1030049 [Paraburkholderia unamae]